MSLKFKFKKIPTVYQSKINDFTVHQSSLQTASSLDLNPSSSKNLHQRQSVCITLLSSPQTLFHPESSL